MAEYQRAIALDPYLLKAHNNLGVIYAAQGRLQEAVAAWKTALAIDPADPQTKRNLEEAVEIARKAP